MTRRRETVRGPLQSTNVQRSAGSRLKKRASLVLQKDFWRVRFHSNAIRKNERIDGCLTNVLKCYSFQTLLVRLFEPCRARLAREHRLRREQARAANLLDLLLSKLTNVSALHNNRLRRKLTLTEKLEDTVIGQVNHRRLGGVLGALLALLLANKSPQLVDVDRRAVVVVLELVEVAHTNLFIQSKALRSVFRQYERHE